MNKLQLATEMARVQGEIRFTVMKIERSERIGASAKIIARHKAALAAFEAELEILRVTWDR